MSTGSSLTNVFSQINLHLSQYLHCPLYIAGNVGNILNLIVFSQLKLRSSSVCSWYFLTVSFVSLIGMNTGYVTRIVAYMGLPDPSRTVGWYCTARVYISTLSLTLGRHFLCSIIVDRFLVTSTNVKLRRMSSFKVVRWYIPLSVIGWMIFYVHIWIGYRGIQTGSACKRQDGVYTLFVTVSSVTIESMIPLLVMITFSVLTLRNVYGLNERRNRIVPITRNSLMITLQTVTMNDGIGTSQVNRSSDHSIQREKRQVRKQLTMISFIQVVVYICCNTISSSYAVYSLITGGIVKSNERITIESFISGFGVMLTFIYGTLNFYIYTLVSSTYRAELHSAVKQSLVIIQRRLRFLF